VRGGFLLSSDTRKPSHSRDYALVVLTRTGAPKRTLSFHDHRKSLIHMEIMTVSNWHEF